MQSNFIVPSPADSGRCTGGLGWIYSKGNRCVMNFIKSLLLGCGLYSFEILPDLFIYSPLLNT